MGGGDPHAARGTRAELRQLVEDAYVFFGGELEGPLEVCRLCCVSPDVELRLTGTPRRMLDLSAVRRYLESAHETTSASCRQLRYFLPRCLDLFVAGHSLTFDPVLSFQKLGACHWREAYPDTEKRLLRRFFSTAFEMVLDARGGDADEHDEVVLFDLTPLGFLEMAALAGDDVPELLALWERRSDAGALTALADTVLFAETNGFVFDGLRLNQPSNPAEEQVRTWLASDPVFAKLTAGQQNEQTGSHAAILDGALGVLRRRRPSRSGDVGL